MEKYDIVVICVGYHSLPPSLPPQSLKLKYLSCYPFYVLIFLSCLALPQLFAFGMILANVDDKCG